MRALSPLRLGAAALVASVALAPRVAPAGDPSGAPAPPADPTIANVRYQLDNGLEVILHQDKTVPLVAVDVWYHVGSGDEVAGRSGFAHLFEHMLFQSSVHVGEDKFFSTLEGIGGTGINGSTNTDRTNYFEVVPSNQIETALWVESDRMGYFLPTLTQESLDNQKEVVRNERRQRLDNVPYGPTEERRYLLAYPEGHPYRHMVIGKHEDLAAANVDDVRRFYQSWYVPANATLVVAGDFELDQAKALVEKWFGSFPKTARPPHRTLPIPVVPAAKQTMADKFAKVRQLSWAWNTPGAYQDGDAEMEILADVLASNTGRLYKRLVVDTQLAVRVFAYQDNQQLSSMFVVVAQLRGDADVAKVEAIVDEELGKVMAKPIEQKEFDRVSVDREAGFVWGLQRLLSRAEILQRYNHYVGTPDYITQDLDRFRKSSPAKVQAMAARYLGKDHRIEILTVPEGK